MVQFPSFFISPLVREGASFMLCCRKCSQYFVCLHVWIVFSLLHSTKSVVLSACSRCIIIITTTATILTAIELLLGGSSPYTSTDKTNKNKYT